MTSFGLVAGVIAVFFVAGIGVGVLIVIALPALRRPRRVPRAKWVGEYRRWHALLADDDSGGADWEDLAGPDDNEARRWPGG
jgi:hypothetical protein